MMMMMMVVVVEDLKQDKVRSMLSRDSSRELIIEGEHQSNSSAHSKQTHTALSTIAKISCSTSLGSSQPRLSSLFIAKVRSPGGDNPRLIRTVTIYPHQPGENKGLTA